MKRYRNNKYWELFFDDGSRILEHRFIMEQYLNRKLDRNEIVHHKNGDPLDNRIENLELHSKETHGKLHGNDKETEYIDIVCSYCSKIVKKKAREVRYKQ